MNNFIEKIICGGELVRGLGLGFINPIGTEECGTCVLNPFETYRCLLPTMYLSVGDITNPDLFACGCRTWISLDFARFYEKQCQQTSGSA